MYGLIQKALSRIVWVMGIVNGNRNFRHYASAYFSKYNLLSRWIGKHFAAYGAQGEFNKQVNKRKNGKLALFFTFKAELA